MKRVLLIALVVVTVGSAVAYCMHRDRGVPSVQTIKEIETLVVMPEAANLAEYTRYYSYGWKGWTPVVVGSYLLMDPSIRDYAGQGPGAAAVEGLPGAFAVQSAPVFYVGVFNSRCQFATVYYDESAKKLLATERDGEQKLVLCNEQ